MLKNDINMDKYIFLFSRLERNNLGQLEIALYYKKSLVSFKSNTPVFIFKYNINLITFISNNIYI